MLRDASAFSGFAVDDVPRYETGPRTDARGIHRTPEVRPVAWFRDPAGNILSVVSGDKS